MKIKIEYGTNILYDFTPTDKINPVITISQSDSTVEHDYTGETISWTATEYY